MQLRRDMLDMISAYIQTGLGLDGVKIVQNKNKRNSLFSDFVNDDGNQSFVWVWPHILEYAQ